MRQVSHRTTRLLREQAYSKAQALVVRAGAYHVIKRRYAPNLVKAYHVWLKNNGWKGWKPDKGDCDDHAWNFITFLNLRNYSTPGTTRMIDIGWILYDIDADPSKYHSINDMVVEADEGHLELVQIEPAPEHVGNPIIDLTWPELQTVTTVIA